MTEPRRYRYEVIVLTDSRDHADQVMGERLGYDEDYGFDYTVEFRWSSSAPTEDSPAFWDDLGQSKWEKGEGF